MKIYFPLLLCYFLSEKRRKNNFRIKMDASWGWRYTANPQLFNPKNETRVWK